MFVVRSMMLGIMMSGVLGLSVAQAQMSEVPHATRAPNTTNISPDLYVRHKRAPNASPELAHCRQMSVMINGHT